MRRLSKKERQQLATKFDGLCAYCGEPLGARWHADHVEPVYRNWYNPKKKGECDFPENDCIENMNPACVPCNLDKAAFTIDGWRLKLSRSLEVLANNYSTYRHAKRFGLLQETHHEIKFYFERIGEAANG